MLLCMLLLAATPATPHAQVHKGDHAGAKQMAQSSITLCKTVGDLDSLVAALRVLSAAHRRGGEAAEAERNDEYLGRKRGELQGRVAAAVEAGWGSLLSYT